MIKLSIVVPCYNEGRNVPEILRQFGEVVGKRQDIELILVDNGSTDETTSTLKKLLPTYPFAKSVRVEVNQGYGFGILTGLKQATGEYLGWTHADQQTHPGDAIRAIDLIKGKDWPTKVFVKGRRYGRSLTDIFFTFGMSIFETIYLGQSLSDVNAQPTIFHQSFFKTWKKPPHDFALDLYAYFWAKKSGLEVLRFPVNFPPRQFGASKWNSGFSARLKFIKRTISFSKNLKTSGAISDAS